MSDLKNILIAIVLAVGVMFGWQFFYELPRLKAKEEMLSKQKKQEVIIKKSIEHKTTEELLQNRVDAISIANKNGRVIIESPNLQGSISLQGVRFDDLILPQYKETLDVKSTPTVLLSPKQYKKPYFVEFGWLSDDIKELPDSNTVWQADKNILRAGENVNFIWKNAQGVVFSINVALDDSYMFTVTQKVHNTMNAPIAIKSYALINRLFDLSEKQFKISHEGPLGVFNGLLKEVSYKDLESDKAVSFENNTVGSWFGISDKYWLTALAPRDKFYSKFQFAKGNKFQVDYVSDKQVVEQGRTAESQTLFFAGAKVLSALEGYEKQFSLVLFDRAIDFGWFYFITKPMLNALKYFHNLVGNFGISIIIVTIIVKLCLFPLAAKSSVSMNKMKELQPEVNRIRELYPDDKMKQNQEMLELYKKKKVTPLSGCLPLFLQIPIFFSLYKVLFITIEMRHAPFYGWIKDLSAPDPTTIFNLFGLIPWTPPHFLMIGIWPIIMSITMFVQQSFSPEPADPVQAKVMKFLPLIFLFMFASFPVGLIIYWAWSNILSIAQQYGMKYIHKT